MADTTPLERLLQDNPVPWSTALLVEVDFRLENRSFACHLVILMPEDEIRALMQAVDRFLEFLSCNGGKLRLHGCWILWSIGWKLASLRSMQR